LPAGKKLRENYTFHLTATAVSIDPDYRPVSYSRTTLTELMIPAYANFGGKIHGGILLSLMDKVAYVCASRHSGLYCVTVSVEGVDFRQPVEVGDLVSLRASVAGKPRRCAALSGGYPAKRTEEGLQPGTGQH
jgi:acyl-CoA hydrolase